MNRTPLSASMRWSKDTHKDVRDVLVLAEQGQVEENLDGLGVCDCCAWTVSAMLRGVLMIHFGNAPAVMTMNSAMPRLSVLVASLALTEAVEARQARLLPRAALRGRRKSASHPFFSCL